MKKSVISDLKQLRQKSELVTEEELPSILQDLEDSFEPYKGKAFGLAAPQIGIRKQVAIIRVNDLRIDLVNPEVVVKEGRERFPSEGCLSFPGVYVDTDRYNEVRILTGIGENRREFYTFGIEAAVVQHEIDHLMGMTLFERKHRKRR